MRILNYKAVISHQGDLNSLGITLFCLLAKINQPGEGFDSNWELDFDLLDIAFEYRLWLEQMCAKKQYDRFIHASTALQKLELIRVKLDKSQKISNVDSERVYLKKLSNRRKYRVRAI